MTSSPNALRAMDRFIKLHGLSPQAAAGLVGGFQAESGRNLDTGAAGDKVRGRPTSFGIYQAHNERADFMRGYKSPFKPADELERQVDAAAAELKGPERRAGGLLAKATDVPSAARAAIGFERPFGFTWQKPEGGAHFDKRLAYADALAKLYSGQAGLTGAAPAGPPPSDSAADAVPPAPSAAPGAPPAAPGADAASLLNERVDPLQLYLQQKQASQQAAEAQTLKASQEAAQPSPIAPAPAPAPAPVLPPMGPYGPLMPTPQGAGLLARKRRGLMTTDLGYGV